MPSEQETGGVSASVAVKPDGWMNDVQRAIALILIGTLSFCTILSTSVSVLVSDPGDALVDMVKTLQAAQVNMGLIALGFFFGNTMAKMAQDLGQQRVVDKLTSTAPPGPTGPVAPLPAPIVVTAWWSLFTSPEQEAIIAASSDPRVQAFIEAAKVGKASPDDLTYLASKGLLKQERQAAILAV